MTPRPPKLSRRRAVVAGWSDDEKAARESLSSTDGGIRASGVGALSRMNLLSIPDLQRALVDPSPEVRRRSLAALPARWGSDLQDVIDLRTLLDESDDAILEMACFVVGECGPVPTTVVRRLIDIAGNHPDALCRESAVAALGSLGDPAGLDAILLACTDKPTIRRRAVLALVVFDDPRADAMLRSLADDVDWQVRQAAEELLAIGDGADSTGDLTNENP